MTLPERRITSAPRIRQVYWCSYPGDAIKPEFSKKRPVVVLSRKSSPSARPGCIPVSAPRRDMLISMIDTLSGSVVYNTRTNSTGR